MDALVWEKYSDFKCHHLRVASNWKFRRNWILVLPSPNICFQKINKDWDSKDSALFQEWWIPRGINFFIVKWLIIHGQWINPAKIWIEQGRIPLHDKGQSSLKLWRFSASNNAYERERCVGALLSPESQAWLGCCVTLGWCFGSINGKWRNIPCPDKGAKLKILQLPEDVSEIGQSNQCPSFRAGWVLIAAPEVLQGAQGHQGEWMCLKQDIRNAQGSAGGSPVPRALGNQERHKAG